MVGIYRIWNTANNKVYVGKSKDIENRWRGHIADLIDGTHPNVGLRNDWKEFGCDCFVFEVLEECSLEELSKRELYWHEFFLSYLTEFGYNSLRSFYTFDGFNCHHSEFSKQKIRDALTGIVRSAETKQLIKDSLASLYAENESLRNRARDIALKQHREMSAEMKAHIGKKIGEANSRRVYSEETRRKKSEATRLQWANKPGRAEELERRRLAEEEEKQLSIERQLKRAAERLAARQREYKCVICGSTFIAIKGKNGRWQTRCSNCKGRWRAKHAT